MFLFRLALALGMTVKRLLSELDSRELTEWIAFDQVNPLPNSWKQTARLCRTVMAASGNYDRVPDENIFIPAMKKPTQAEAEMIAELKKLQGL
jgi:hypothetical protein